MDDGDADMVVGAGLSVSCERERAEMNAVKRGGMGLVQAALPLV